MSAASPTATGSAAYGHRLHMGTAFTPAKTSPTSWDAFSDVEAFVDAVLAGPWRQTAPGGPAPGRSRR
jgi:hypothetical protein